MNDRQDGAADESAQSRVAGIIDRARERNLDRAAELGSWVVAAQQGRLSAQDRSVAAEVAHQLAGSAGTFGYLTATDIARELEGLFAEGGGAAHWTHTGARVQELVSRLREAPESDALPTTEIS
jgi:predicted SpoU family rRNA methylase